MGYQVGVTPLQMVAAVSSVANGGQYVEPRIVRALYRDNRRFVVQPKVVQRPIRADTAASMTQIMEGVVADKHGTATRAQIPGFTIAGKTGTAEKLIKGQGQSPAHYSHTEYNASFVGFVPSRDPAIAVIVVIDSPHGPNRYSGGTVSAPIFKRIVEPTLRYLGVGPTINPPPPVLVQRHSESPNAQISAAGEAEPPVVSLVANALPGTVPDVHGMSAREAVRVLVKVGLAVHVSGDGVVISQDPEPGAPIDAGSVCRLVLDRRATRTEAVHP
jgi:membrane peptidoglycan carboxypeptidase